MTTLPSPSGAVGRPPARNRRVTIRYRCAPATAGRVCLAEDQEFQRAWVENLSRGGAGLYLSKPLSDGIALVLQMRQGSAGPISEITGRVIYSTLKEPYGWYLGIAFESQLPEELLDDLLA